MVLDKILKYRKYGLYFIPSLIVVFVMLLVYAAKGIYPFGSESIAYADMGQCYIPFYYHLYDAMRGLKSIFFDWYDGLGINTVGITSFISLLSPVNLFFYFVPRDRILESMSFFLILKMALMALTCSIFLKKRFNLNFFWINSFSLVYAFCGYVMQYHTNIMWLDIAIIFPLIILALFVLFEQKKIAPYIVVLSMSLIINFYISFMVVLFLLFFGGLYIILIAPKSERGINVINFGFSSTIIVLISAFITLPAFLQMSESARGGQSKTYAQILSSWNIQNSGFVMFLCTSLCLIPLILMLASWKKNKRPVTFFAGAVFIVAAQVVFEGVNLIWHTGSYVLFPFRFGFMIPFTMLMAGGYYISNVKGVLIAPLKTLREDIICTVISILFFLGAVHVYFGMISENGYGSFAFGVGDSVFQSLLIIFFLVFPAYLLLTHLKSKKFAYIVMSVLLICEVVAYSYLFIGIPGEKIYGFEHKLDFIQMNDDIKNELDLKTDNLSRIKNPDNLLHANYGFILGMPSISNYIHMLPGYIQSSLFAMGYSKAYTLTLDPGGTAFSDALLNFKNTITMIPMSEKLYTEIAQAGGMTYYGNKYTLPFGITMNSAVMDDSILSGNAFEVQNNLYRAVTGSNENIISIKRLRELTQTGGGEYIKDENYIEYTKQNSQLIMSFEVKEEKALYFKCDGIPEYSLSINVNGNTIPIPSVANAGNERYPAQHNSNIINLGVFENETVFITITMHKEINAGQILMGSLDVKMLENLTNSYSEHPNNAIASNTRVNLTATGTSEKNILLIPIGYSDSWGCKVNGEKTEIKQAVGCLMAVELQNGENTIELKFSPKGMREGSIISLTALLGLAGLWYYNRRKPVKFNRFVLNASEKAFYVIYFLAVQIVYITPIIVALIIKFQTLSD